MFKLKDKGFIMDPNENQLGTFAAKFRAVRATYWIKTLQEENLLTVRQKLVALMTTFRFYDGSDLEGDDDDQLLGTLKKKLGLRPKYQFETKDGQLLFEIKGNVLGFKFDVLQGKQKIAQISNKFFRIRNTYGVRIDQSVSDFDTMLIIGSVIVLHYVKERNQEQQRKRRRR
ncbi:MAG: LURP-one-related family protein [Candidatus Heimdallarchaeota archaeon]|nr:LURP-one-related family protein [Candidatus Heimdallarchaeota archaeon]